MEETTPKINFTELKNYHLELFREMFGASEGIEQLFNVVWKNHLQAELVTELIKRESKYFAK